MKIFLIGLPGSGKSTVGKELAVLLDSAFIDLDLEIEELDGIPIKTIFSAKGENYFRRIEHEILVKRCSEESDFIMATGGGVPCFHDNMKLIKTAGRTVFLDVPVEEIVRRIKRTERSDRPLLGHIHTNDLHEQLVQLRRVRLPFYTQAHVTVSGTKLNAGSVMRMING